MTYARRAPRSRRGEAGAPRQRPADPRALSRGRAGVWVPGGELPPLQDFIGTQPSESVLGMRIINECRLRRQTYPELLRIFHIPNGGSRGPAEAGRFKAEGVRPFVPDYMLPVARGGHHGMFLELKKHNGALSPGQRLELEQLSAAGYHAVCAWGSGAAMDALLAYLDA